jgi:uncharacterized protein (UPF0210 family)
LPDTALRPPIRAITVGVAEPHPLSPAAIADGAARARRARDAFETEGYAVQSIRLSTRPVLEDLADWAPAAIVDYAVALDSQLREEAGEPILSVGTAQADRPGFVLERIGILADVLVATRSIYGTVQVATVDNGMRAEAALPAARVATRLSRETDEGFGSFRFAVLACVEPGAPFFPAGYHRGPASLSIGWQGASLVAAAAAGVGGNDFTERVREAIASAGAPIVAIGQRTADEVGLGFGGLDVSPAPAGDDSIGAAIESSGNGPVGSHGTLAVVSAITAALKTTGLPTCGYCGLMLPVLEDTVLAQRWADGLIGIDQLLAYSAICGTGLDAVPLAGDTSEEVIAAIYRDVATMALRLNKPLSARLMPIPGKHRGESTAFTSPYLVDTRI